MVPSWVPDPPVGEIPAENQAPADATDQPVAPFNLALLDTTPQRALIAPRDVFKERAEALASSHGLATIMICGVVWGTMSALATEVRLRPRAD